MISIKLYEVKFLEYVEESEWHSRDRTAGIFTQRTDAENIAKKIKNIKDKQGRQKYETYILIIDINKIANPVLRNEMKIYYKKKH